MSCNIQFLVGLPDSYQGNSSSTFISSCFAAGRGDEYARSMIAPSERITRKGTDSRSLSVSGEISFFRLPNTVALLWGNNSGEMLTLRRLRMKLANTADAA